MKKILVVLLILAVAGGVFAQQGQWSLGGSVEIGTRLDIDPDPEIDRDPDDPIIVDGIAYHSWDAIRGALGIGYTKGAVYVGLGITTTDETRLTASFDNDTFRGKLQFDNLWGILTSDNHYTRDGVNSATGSNGWAYFSRSDASRLWGEFNFFDGMITLKAAYRSDDSEYWFSDKTAVFNNKISKWKTSWSAFDDVGEGTFTFNEGWMKDSGGSFMQNNHLLVKADVNALSFGMMIPRMFNFAGYWSGDPLSDGAASMTNPKNAFVDGSLKQSVIGVSFDQSPLMFAAQFMFDIYGVYFGGTFNAGPITVGLSFMGVLDGDGQGTNGVSADADPQHIKVGGTVDYSGSGFGGGVKAFYDRADEVLTGASSDYYLTTIGIEPYLFYDAIPSHLRFKLDIGFYFLDETDGTESEKATVWALQPQLFWNFLGTGAGTYWSYDTGIMVRYRMANADTRDLPRFGSATNNSVNFLDVVFKWGF